MKLYAPLSIIEKYTRVQFASYGLYKITVYNPNDYDIVIYSNNSRAFDRIVYDNCESKYQRGSGNYTLRQAYASMLSPLQISLINKLYKTHAYETKSIC